MAHVVNANKPMRISRVSTTRSAALAFTVMSPYPTVRTDITCPCTGANTGGIAGHPSLARGFQTAGIFRWGILRVTEPATSTSAASPLP